MTGFFTRQMFERAAPLAPRRGRHGDSKSLRPGPRPQAQARELRSQSSRTDRGAWRVVVVVVVVFYFACLFAI